MVAIGLMRETESSQRSIEAYVAMTVSSICGLNQREARGDNWLLVIFVCFSVFGTADAIDYQGTRRLSTLRLIRK